ncbi:MAG: hypothetical protein IPK16_30990 [Anaerolineales bacterium]|nr:hypothetical protein [Anaerolineales bacterium]
MVIDGEDDHRFEGGIDWFGQQRRVEAFLDISLQVGHIAAATGREPLYVEIRMGRTLRRRHAAEVKAEAVGFLFEHA